MKYLLIIMMLIPLFSFSQTEAREITLLDGWTFSKDTTVYITQEYQYRFDIQLNASSLTGTLDGLIKVKKKHSNMGLVFYSDSVNSTKTINGANIRLSFTGLNLMADTLAVEFVQNNISGGTLKSKIRMFKKHD